MMSHESEDGPSNGRNLPELTAELLGAFARELVRVHRAAEQKDAGSASLREICRKYIFSGNGEAFMRGLVSRIQDLPENERRVLLGWCKAQPIFPLENRDTDQGNAEHAVPVGSDEALKDALDAFTSLGRLYHFLEDRPDPLRSDLFHVIELQAGHVLCELEDLHIMDALGVEDPTRWIHDQVLDHAIRTPEFSGFAGFILPRLRELLETAASNDSAAEFADAVANADAVHSPAGDAGSAPRGGREIAAEFLETIEYRGIIDQLKALILPRGASDPWFAPVDAMIDRLLEGREVSFNPLFVTEMRAEAALFMLDALTRARPGATIGIGPSPITANVYMLFARAGAARPLPAVCEATAATLNAGGESSVAAYLGLDAARDEPVLRFLAKLRALAREHGSRFLALASEQRGGDADLALTFPRAGTTGWYAAHDALTMEHGIEGRFAALAQAVKEIGLERGTGPCRTVLLDPARLDSAVDFVMKDQRLPAWLGRQLLLGRAEQVLWILESGDDLTAVEPGESFEDASVPIAGGRSRG